MAKRGVNNRSKKIQASKPYDVSNSFVKKVASRVTELLPQSIWPSKWFSSGNLDVHPHGNGREILNTPINTENEDADQNPPAKRARIPSKSSFGDTLFSASTSASDYETRRLRTRPSISPVEDAYDEPVAGPSGIQRQCPVETSESLVSKSQDSFCYNSKKLEINGEDHSDSSESTSGCSSLPQADHNTEMRSSASQSRTKEREINGPEPVSRSAVKRTHEGAANFSSMAIHGSRLFPGFGSYSPPTRATPVPVGRRRNPSFNPDAFGSQQWSGEKTNIKDRIVNSPFYSGRTTYGGVSAYQSSLNRTETQSHYLRGAQRSIQIRPVNTMEAKESSTGMSNTARRIMEALEMFSSPIQDAKKIPLDGSMNMKRRRVLANADFSQTMHSSQLSHLKEDSTSHRLGDYAPSVKELSIPTVPDILAMRRRQRLQGSTVAARQMASESCMNSVIIEKDSECDRFPLPYQDKRNSRRCGGKIKSNEEVDEEPNEEPDLPNIVLPITSLPKFDFVLQPVLHTSSPPNCCYSNSSPARQVNQSVFKFSSPIAFSNTSDTLVSHSNFTFSSPLKATSEDRIDNHGPTTDVSISTVAIKRPFEKKTRKDSSLIENNSMDKERARSLEKAWSKDVKKVESKSCSEGVALPKAVQGNLVNLQFSVGSKLSEKEGFGDKFKPSAGTWECVTCMVRNSAEASKCVACETPNSKMCTSESVNIKNTSTENTSGFGDRFKPPSGSWSCDVCMVRNPDSANKCQACETARVKGSSSISGTENSKTDDKSVSKSGFGDRFKKPVGDWECTICLVMNKAGGPPKCVACEAPKPGAEPVSAGSTSSSLAPKFSFGSTAASSGFNFGIDKAGEVPKKESSSEAQPSFTFGAAVSTAPGTFSFGGKSEGTKEVSGFKFGVPTPSETPKSESSKKLPELQSLPKFTFGSKESSEKPSKPTQEMTKVVTDSRSGNDKESETKLLKEPEFKSGVGASITLPSRICTFASSKPSVVADLKPSFTFASTENKKEPISASGNYTLGNNSPISKIEDAKTTSVVFGVSSPPSNNMTTFSASTSGWSNNPVFKLDASPKAPLFPRTTTSLPSITLPSNNSSNNKSEEFSKTGPTTFKFGDTSKSDTLNKFQEVPKTVSSSFKFQETAKTSASIFSLTEKSKTTLTSASLPSSTITSNPFTSGGFSGLNNNKLPVGSEVPTSVPVSSQQSISSEPSETKSGNSGQVFLFGSGSTPQAPAFNLIGQKQPTQTINTNTEELVKPFGNNIAATPNVFGSLVSSSKAPLFGSTTPSPSPGASVLPAATSENRSATSTAFVTPTSNPVFCSPNTTSVTSTNTTTATTVSSASSTFGSSFFGSPAPNFAAVGSTPPTFGSSTSAPLANPPAFGAAPSSSAVFGLTSTPSSTPFSFSAGTKSTTEEQQTNPQTNAPFVFGGGAATPAAQPFAFNSAPSKPTFSFGSSAVSSQPAVGTCASVPAPAAAPALGFSFGDTSKVATPFGSVQPATSIAGGSSNPFGSSSAVPVASITHAAPSTFGAPLGESSAPTSGTFGAPTFNFGSSQSNPVFSFNNNQTANIQSNISQPAAFNFGQAPQPSTAPQQVTFNPNIPPSFNFTGGATPQFTATPGVINTVPAANPMQRRFKKAVRRSQQPR